MVNDAPDGVWTDYHPTGKPSATGVRVGRVNEGEWETFWSTGEAWRDVEYVAGEEQTQAAQACSEMAGDWTADGEKRTLGCMVCRARDDDSVDMVAMGVWTFWHPSGGIEKQGALLEGRPHGEWKYFHDNGAVMMQGVFDGGVESGPWRGQWRNGAPRFEGHYAGGKPEGTWTSWLTDGGVLSQGRYEHGEKTGVWRYDRRGQLVTETQAERDARRRDAPDAGP